MRKNILLVVALIAITFMTHAQDDGDKIGVHIGASTGDIADVSSFNFALEYGSMWSAGDSFSYGGVIGYTRYIGKNYDIVQYSPTGPITTTIEGEDFGYIHAALALKYSFVESFFVEGDFGYAINFGSDGGDTGFFVQPKVGWQTEYFDVFVSYKTVATEVSVSSIGIGAAYKFY